MNSQKEDLYAGLGYLFYSIASSDSRVSKEEAVKLKTLVKEKWMPGENKRDAAGTDIAYYIEIGFDHANNAGMAPDKAFERFKQAYDSHRDLFDPSTRNLVTRTAQAIADAIQGRNQDERRILERLKEVFL
jgi:hypothetical protein